MWLEYWQLKILVFYIKIYILHLADTFIQSDLQMRTFKIYKNVYF